VLMVRETPLHSGHLRNMLNASDMGAVIAPPVPAFYAKPESLGQMVDHTLGRILDLFGLESGAVRRWGEDGNVPEWEVNTGCDGDAVSAKLGEPHPFLKKVF